MVIKQQMQETKLVNIAYDYMLQNKEAQKVTVGSLKTNSDETFSLSPVCQTKYCTELHKLWFYTPFPFLQTNILKKAIQSTLNSLSWVVALKKLSIFLLAY